MPLVADDPKLFWGSMLARMPLKKYLSMTDLVFAILVLEHHMMKWRHLIHFQLETGRSPSEDFTQQSGGLLYRDGIAGEAAKQRFEDLYVYFFSNFCAAKHPDNVRRLQAALDDMARNGSVSLKADIKNCGAGGAAVGPQSQQIQDDVLHRVFNYVFL